MNYNFDIKYFFFIGIQKHIQQIYGLMIFNWIMFKYICLNKKKNHNFKSKSSEYN